jgi:uncharacterized Ntn-hydrolase superfamily protein
MTYTILARDAATGDLGIGATSGYLAVGATVPWARAGIGAVATQALTEPAYGAAVLDRLAAGTPVVDALEAALAADPHRELRQVGVIDGDGAVAAHTGSGCIPHAGHACGEGWLAMGNLLRMPGTARVVATAFETGAGSFAERIVKALVAGQEHGGDLRGRRSAALLVVSAADTGLDLRVDDHPDPLQELLRLTNLGHGYRLLGTGINRWFGGDGVGATDALDAARRRAPADPQVEFWHRVAAGRPVADLGPEWEELRLRLERSGRLGQRSAPEVDDGSTRHPYPAGS